MINILVIALTAILLIAGLIGTLKPFIPGTPLIFVGVLFYAFATNFETIGLGLLVVLFVLMAAAFLPDLFSASAGARSANASIAAEIGTAIGGLLGFMMFSWVGALLGVFVGAFMGELVYAESSGKKSLNVAIGSFLGFLSGTIVKFVIAIAMVITFIAAAV